MELFSILGLSGPIFYIIGLVAFIRWLVRGGRSGEKVGEAKAAAELRRQAALASPEAAHILLDVATRLDGAMVLGGMPGAAGAVAASAVASSAPSANGVAAGDVSGGHEPVAGPPPAVRSGLHTDLGDVTRSLDNINVLLYLGAFLIVVSAGIFVGYNFSVLSGVFKTIFLALFALAFYFVGLILFLYSKKLRPAGVTFTGIGLVMLPLVGLAAYNFTSLHDHRDGTWFVTSLLTLIAYVITIYITRQTYVAYLMAFTTLSLFESGVSLFDVPVYWFGWAMATVSILLLSIPWRKFLWEDAESAMRMSANVFLPVSLVLSVAVVEPEGMAQFGVTLALAGVFYSAMARRSENQPAGEANWVLALLCLPAALTAGLWDALPHHTLAAVLMAVAGAYLAGIFTLGSKLSERWLMLWALVAGLLPFGGLMLVLQQPWELAAVLAGAVLINAILALWLRQTALALLAVISFLILPFVVVRYCLDPALPWSVVAIALLAEAAVLVWWARRIKDWPDSGAALGVFGYLAAIGLAIAAAGISSQTALLWVSLVAAAMVAGLSYTEQRSEFMYLAAATLYLALCQPAGILEWDGSATALLLLISGFAIYGLGWVETDPDRSKALRYSGIAGPFLGAVAGLSIQYADTQTHNLIPALALAGGGSLLLLEARRQSKVLLEEVAGGILILALNWACGILEVDQTQVYTLPWAAYLAFLGWRRREQGHQAYDGFAVAALFMLTVPLAGQALAEDGQMYGLALILEAIVLVFVGMALRYKLITIWGAATLVAEVLYQMRDFFYAMPKYFISAGLGLALLVVAIVMLQRRKGGD